MVAQNFNFTEDTKMTKKFLQSLRELLKRDERYFIIKQQYRAEKNVKAVHKDQLLGLIFETFSVNLY